MGSIAFDFTGHSVVISGAARGIGLELARSFTESGAVVFMLDMDEPVLTAEAAALGAVALCGDVSTSEFCDAAVAAVMETEGHIDVLVNNAGILRDRVLWKMTDEDWDAVLAVHLGGTFRLTRACVPSFRRQGYGRVVNVTSYTGLHGNRGQANYAAAKAGIIGFTLTAAKELAPFGVTVNAISPNAETRMTASLTDEQRAAFGAPIPRFAHPREISAGVSFLASQEAGYITGVVLPIDGGLSI